MDLALGGYGNLYEKVKFSFQDKFRPNVPMPRTISVESDESSSSSEAFESPGFATRFRTTVSTLKNACKGTFQEVKDKLGSLNYGDGKCGETALSLDPLGPCFSVGLFKRVILSPRFLGSRYQFTQIEENDDFEEPETLIDWDCEFLHLLNDYGLSRQAYVNALENVTLMGAHHPFVDELMSKWRENQGLDLEDGEDLLYLTLGKALAFDLDNTQDNVLEAAEKQVLLQEAIQTRLEETGVSQDMYDQIEGYAWLFCENNLAPRNVDDFLACVEELMQTVNEDVLYSVSLDDIFGPVSLLVQVGPHKCIMQTHTGVVKPHEDFYPLEDAGKYPKKGHKLGDSHWGPVYSIDAGDFNSQMVVKVISLSKWEKKKNGVDGWNDDVSSEIQAHRHLDSMNIKNVVRFVAVTMDARNLYYYMEEGVELFTYVQKHREKHWYQWKKTLIKMGPRKYADIASPWELRAKQIFRGVFEALNKMHSLGIVHRDLKLENLIVVSNGEELEGKIIDFGVTLRHGQWESDMLNQGKVGTYPFMAPEMCFNNNEFYAKSRGVELENYEHYNAAKNDIWTMGHALWGFNMAVLMWENIGSIDNRFTVATHAKFCDAPDKWTHKKMGLRYLAKRYGPQRNCMATDKLIDLMEHIFCPESERFSAQQCLDHPWFQQELEVEPMTPVSPNSVASLI